MSSCGSLPYYEQGPLYNAYNSSTDATHPSNITLAGVGISTLWCPSDPIATDPVNLAGPDPYGYYSNLGGNFGYVLPPGNWNQTQKSYANVFGPICQFGGGALGTIKSDGKVTTIAAVTDGTSNTLLFTELSRGYVPTSIIQSQAVYYPWNLGKNDEVDTEYAPNPRRYFPQASFGTHARYIAASMHPGGLNASFADGSVKFLKDSISSWPGVSPVTGAPANYYTIAFNVISLKPFNFTESISWTAAAKLGVWQALSTRAGGEVVSSDSY